VLEEARIAIVGGGIAGCSLAYHLTRLGESDVALLEQFDLTQGTTWHAAGLCTQFSGSYNLMSLLRRSVELYRSLDVSYHETGSLRLAASEDRLDEFRHVAGVAAQVGVPFEFVSAARAAELFPLLRPDGLLGAAYLPTDGWVDPATAANALAKGAAGRGARIHRRTPVTALRRECGVWRLETPRGEVRAKAVVCTAGQWSRQVARLAGADLPIVPMEHHYVLTDAIEQVRSRAAELPVLRDPEASFYVRQDGESLLVGPFERDPRPWSVDGIPRGFSGRLLRPDLKRIAPALDAAAERLPVLGETGIRKAINGPDGYTPDGRCLMGPVPGLPDFWVLAGFSIFGIVFSGGAGSYAAEWILDGQPSDTMWELDVRRFGEYACPTSYVVERACEVYRREYDIHFPEEERPAGRPLRTSPLYELLAERGAVYGERFGWERPLWFARPGDEPRDAYSFRRGNWHEAVGEECRAVRSAVGVLDQTSFAKFEVSGPGAEALLDRLCANALPGEAGRMALTQMCTPKGGIECDVTVTRLAGDRFYVVSAAATADHDRDWIARHAPEDGSVDVADVTGRYGVLTLAGPRSRELLAAVTDADVSREAFPFFRCRELAIGGAPVRALRVSYVGELGYELHHPLEHQRRLYELLREAGEPLGLVDFGYRALDSLRLEKAYRLWGADLSADWTPLEAGLERFVRFDKGDFLGRDALLRQRERGVERVLSCLVVEAGDADAQGYEPVRAGERTAGYVASGGYGHTVGASIALAYLPVELSTPGTELEVEILGVQRPARVVEQPLYDPGNERLLG
jgi:dimethylglycine dehydrogenase